MLTKSNSEMKLNSEAKIDTEDQKAKILLGIDWKGNFIRYWEFNNLLK